MGDHEPRTARAKTLAHDTSPAHATPGKSTEYQPGTSEPTWDGKPYKGSVFGAKAPPAVEKRVRGLITTLDMHSKIALARLGEAGSDVRPSELEMMRRQLVETRGALLTELVHLPTGGRLMTKAFAASDRATTAVSRVDAALRGHSARTATLNHAATREDTALVFDTAGNRQPEGYCDSAPQRVAPCELDPATRARYRRFIVERVSQAQTAWSDAIGAIHLEEKFKPDKLAFEKALAGVMFGVLFDVLALVAKGAVNAQGVAEKAVDKAGSVGQDLAKSGAMSARDLDARARGAVQVPETREEFLQTYKAVPVKWRNSVVRNVEHLFDIDLAALVARWPDEDQTMPAVFEQRIRDVLQRYEQQVLAVNLAPISDTRPVQVITQGSIRVALARPEKQPNQKLRGEWRNSPTRTGKWTFVRWVDNDMRDMAVARAIGMDRTAAMMMRTASDARFWDARSLHLLAQPASEQPVQP